MEVSLQAGRIVGEHWRLRGRLGDKTKSRFWEAEELRTGARVAIELARVDLSEPQAKLRFSRETRALCALRNPHIVRTLHRGLANDGLAFTVTELLRGEDLRHLLAREPALGLTAVAQIVDQVCRGMSRLDAIQVPRRVLEPKHVFVVSDRSSPPVIKLLNVRLGDVPARKRTDSSSQYLSPESVSAVTTATEAAQVWALGVLGCRMLTGALPFDADSRATLVDDWAARFTRLRETQLELPTELDEWFRTAIHPDPSQRFATMEQAGLALGHIATTYASSVTARAARLHPKMDRSSQATPLPTRSASLQPEPQPSSVVPERARVAMPAARPRAPVMELDRSASWQSAPAAVIEALRPATAPHVSQMSIEGSVSVAVDRMLELEAHKHAALHDRETVASRVHAAAVKRRKRVVAADRTASVGLAATLEALPPAPAESLATRDLRRAFLLEPAPIVVREQATLTPDNESTHPGRAAPLIASTASVVSRAPARELVFGDGRSDSSAAERARALRIERNRWRVSAVLAVVIGLCGGFALRSWVSMNARSAQVAPDGAAFEETISARTAVVETEPHPLTVAREAAAAPTTAELTVQPGTNTRLATNASNVRRPATAISPLKRGAAQPPLSTASREPSSLDMPTEPPPPAVAATARLPAAPQPADTTPLQVYRGF